MDEVMFVAKAGVGLLATVLLVVHMLKTWDRVQKWGQVLRYFTLAGFATLTVGRSVEQLTDDQDGDFWAWYAFGLVTLLLVTVVVSMREDRARTQ